MSHRRTLFGALGRAFILWGVRRTRIKWGEDTTRPYGQNVVTFSAHGTKKLFRRFQSFWFDESIRNGKHFNRPPWWRPFNILLHWWCPEDGVEEAMHDHPRWSVTICLRGRIVERTPWSERELRPGSVVIRSRKAIHAFRVLEPRRTWTLFIVGPRNHRQNSYILNPERSTDTRIA